MVISNEDAWEAGGTGVKGLHKVTHFVLPKSHRESD
jgi:hypothetical protein